MRTWFITGAGRGLGAAIADAALDAGESVAAAGRDVEAIHRRFAGHDDRVTAVELDVTRHDRIRRVVDDVVERCGPIDVVVNNAGYGQFGIFEEVGPEAIRRQFDVNVFGTMEIVRAFLPHLRSRRRGWIVNVSSIAGVAGSVGGSAYSASKFAVSGFSESLALEVAELGIAVTIVEPGYFRTDLLDASSAQWANSGAINDYADIASSARAMREDRNHLQPGDPMKLGRLLVALADQAAPPLHLAVGSDAVRVVRSHAEARLAELSAYEAQSRSTDF